MSAPQKLRDLRHVIEGRIRKTWPCRRFKGFRVPETSKSKGLRNPGLLCYRNAVLQCLLHVPEFVQYLDRQDRCATPGDNCVFCTLRVLANEYWTSTRSKSRYRALGSVNTAMDNHVQPNVVYNFLRPAGSNVNDMNASGQQDAHEYFIGLTNMLKHINDDMIHQVR